jgi:UDP-2,3-diacylglucosamine hydrolase
MSSPTSALVVSDIHLGVTPPEGVRAFHAWLDQEASATNHLVLNGDLFDFWFEYRSVIPRGHTRTLGRLAALVDAGVRIDFLGGNHDWWGGSFLRDEIGLHVHPDPLRLKLAGHETLLAHGDGLGQGDLGYRMLRTLLRGTLTQWAFRWLHPDLGARVAQRVSRTELRSGPPEPRVLARSEALSRWARERLLEDEALDAVVLGHTHLPKREEVAEGRFHLNAGDWLTHRSWIRFTPDHPPELLRWNDGLPEPFRGS